MIYVKPKNVLQHPKPMERFFLYVQEKLKSHFRFDKTNNDQAFEVANDISYILPALTANNQYSEVRDGAHLSLSIQLHRYLAEMIPYILNKLDIVYFRSFLNF